MLSNALLEEILQKACEFVEDKDKGGAVALIQPHPYNDRAYFVVDGEQAVKVSVTNPFSFELNCDRCKGNLLKKFICEHSVAVAQRSGRLETYLMAAVEEFDLECGYHRFQATVPPGAGEKGPQRRYGGKPTVPSPHEYRARQLPPPFQNRIPNMVNFFRNNFCPSLCLSVFNLVS